MCVSVCLCYLGVARAYHENSAHTNMAGAHSFSPHPRIHPEFPTLAYAAPQLLSAHNASLKKQAEAKTALPWAGAPSAPDLGDTCVPVADTHDRG